MGLALDHLENDLGSNLIATQCPSVRSIQTFMWDRVLRVIMMTSSNENIFRVTGLCATNSPVTGEFPSQRPVTRSFDIFFDLHPNKCLNSQIKKNYALPAMEVRLIFGNRMWYMNATENGHILRQVRMLHSCYVCAVSLSGWDHCLLACNSGFG